MSETSLVLCIVFQFDADTIQKNFQVFVNSFLNLMLPMLFGLCACRSALLQTTKSISIEQHFPDAFSLNQCICSFSPTSRSNVAVAVTIFWEFFSRLA